MGRAERRWLQRGISQAIAGDGFHVHYQPRLKLATGEPTGAEALLRWPHRKRGFISPATFIPVAEAGGHITTIGGWVLRTACAEAACWPSTNGSRLCISVNISGRQLGDGSLLGHIAAALEASGLQPDCLELEFTETILVGVEVEMLLTLSAIRDLGVRLALDDFGTGFASLGMLKRLPLTTMKLDRSMIRDLPDDREDAAIARAIVEAGHALGLTVVAEGIETENQRAFLSGIGCDEGQGFLFGAALPADALRAQMAAD